MPVENTATETKRYRLMFNRVAKHWRVEEGEPVGLDAEMRWRTVFESGFEGEARNTLIRLRLKEAEANAWVEID